MPVSRETIARAEEALRERLSGKRLDHSFGVADTAEQLAAVYGVDPGEARIAGLLHDWDKQLTREELLARIEEFDIDVPKKMKKVTSLLHAPTGAAAIRREFPEVPSSVADAIARHTVPIVDMTDLDMVLYIADKIEPTRPAQDIKAVWDNVGKVSLWELYFQTYQSSLVWMIHKCKPIYPKGFKVYNVLAKRYNEMKERSDIS